jgi:hypothetical protein
MSALGQVQVAEHLLPDPDRNPEETVHRRVRGRESGRARIVPEIMQPDRVRIIDQRTEQPLALREVTDSPDRVRGHPGVHELRQPALRREHPEGGVPRTDQFPGRLDDPQQHGIQTQVRDDRLIGPQQPAQPALGGPDLLRSLDQLVEKLIQFQAGHIGKGQSVGAALLTIRILIMNRHGTTV